MKRIFLLAVIGIAILIAVPVITRNKYMADNEKYLKEAQIKIREFETEKEAERLREAYMTLENVYLAQEYNPQIRARLRSDCLSLWLTLLQILDQNLDPKFNPDDVPQNIVQPPPLPDGTVLRPGADPAKIADPQARAEYEKAIAENRAKADNYRLQTELRRLDEQIPPRAEEFIKNSYTSADADQEELKRVVNEIIQKPERKAELSKLLKSSQP